MTGIVASYNNKRGFGFIRPLCGQGDDVEALFFHVTSVVDDQGKHTEATPPIGSEVSFTLSRSAREGGLEAANVIVRAVKDPRYSPKPQRAPHSGGDENL